MATFSNPDGMPKQLGLYSHVASSRATNIISIAGQIGVNLDGTLPLTMSGQMDNIFTYFGAALRSHEMTYDHIIQMTTYVTGREHIAPFYEHRATLYPGLFSTEAYPPNTLLIIDGLVLPEAIIEISAIAAA